MRPAPQAALDLVKTFEGFRPTRYSDTGGVQTIGYGHKLTTGDPLWNASISETSAEEVAMDDLDTTGLEIQNVLGPQQVSLFTDGQWAALLDFVFNEGIGRFEGSTLCAMIRAGQLQSAGEQFGRWVYGVVNGVETQLDGLVKRRAAEAALWVS